MKRLYTLFLAVLLLFVAVACQPTPPSEYVVNKRDGDLEQKLSGARDLTPQVLPERWDEVYEGELMTLTFSALIEQKADGLYPLYRTRANPLTDEQIVEILTVLFPDPVFERATLPTKADIQREMEWYLSEAEAKLAWQDAGRPDDGVDRDETPLSREEVEEELKNYQQLINQAPDQNEERPVTGYRVPIAGKEGPVVFGRKDGSSLYVSPSWDLLRRQTMKKRSVCFPNQDSQAYAAFEGSIYF